MIQKKKNTEWDVCVLFLYAETCQTPCMTICLYQETTVE